MKRLRCDRLCGARLGRSVRLARLRLPIRVLLLIHSCLTLPITGDPRRPSDAVGIVA